MSRPVRFRNDRLRKLAATATAAGWTIAHTGGDHCRWTPPGDQPFIISAYSPSDSRAVYNLRARLRRAGLEVV